MQTLVVDDILDSCTDAELSTLLEIARDENRPDAVFTIEAELRRRRAGFMGRTVA